MPTEVVTKGIIGATGPATIAVGSVITARGRLAVGNSAGTPIALAPGASGTYLRSNGTDPLYSALIAADMPAAIDAAKINTGVVSNAEFNFLSNVTSDIQTQLNAKSASPHGHVLNTERGIFIDQAISSAATPSDNTASTVTWAVALDLTLVLPTGTWVVHAVGACNLKHSASGSSQFRVSIAGTDSSPRTPDTLSSTVYTRIEDANQLSAQTGTIHVYCHFRTLAGSAGTTFANNPRIWVTCERSS